MKRKYGISLEDEIAMLEAQDGKCPVCREQFDGDHHVDHDHVTGQVRALLCGRCNVALGSAGDDPELLRALATYVESFAILSAVITDR